LPLPPAGIGRRRAGLRLRPAGVGLAPADVPVTASAQIGSEVTDVTAVAYPPLVNLFVALLTSPPEPRRQGPLRQQPHRIGPPLLRRGPLHTCPLLFLRPALASAWATLTPGAPLGPAVPKERIGRRLHRPHQQRPHLRIKPASYLHHAVVRHPGTEPPAPVPDLFRRELALPVQRLPAPDHPLQVHRRAGAGESQQRGLVLGPRHAREGANLGERQLTVLHGLGGQGQVLQGQRRAQAFPGGARPNADAPGQPLGGGGEAGPLPPLPPVELGQELHGPVVKGVGLHVGVGARLAQQKELVVGIRGLTGHRRSLLRSDPDLRRPRGDQVRARNQLRRSLPREPRPESHSVAPSVGFPYQPRPEGRLLPTPVPFFRSPGPKPASPFHVCSFSHGVHPLLLSSS